MLMWLTIETDIPPGLELAWKESIAMDLEDFMNQTVRVIKIETAKEGKKNESH